MLVTDPNLRTKRSRYLGCCFPDGFSLPEMMVALILGSMMVLSSVNIYPQLRQRLTAVYQHYRLELSMQRVISIIEKDLRRAGFCNGFCQGRRLFLGQYSGEKANSCVIVAYDLNRNGLWEGGKHKHSEYFGYRLRKNQLESARGETDCQSSGWERLFDATEVFITGFDVQREYIPLRGNLLTLSLSGQVGKRSQVQHGLQRRVRVYNL
ncbi:prepilin peptidase-dependent protein [Yersinia nurmii]|uniref:Prepilin peptidase-dependent protein n=1 Tax=Yersinia nurmii TaxID=685706 RepID=A0AAW7JZH8_9GAMM|nr:prepilin peptidase-dependent protein [Yersinia nurmii]MDN0087693.1 prepilin peptidase-dependent protein [Yersinia nurmii]CNE85702.1 putative prepilin peptidase dependent protein [Yersinia nurmii]